MPEDVSADRVMVELIRELASMPSGARLDSERLLAERLGVSRTALRDRIARLESMGVLERRAGSGTYVQAPRASTVSESLHFALLARGLSVDAMIPVRWALEREAARWAAQGNDRQAHRAMEDAVDRMSADQSVDGVHTADQDFHTALLDASGAQGLRFFWEMTWTVLSQSIREMVAEDERARMQPIHAAILDAVRQGDQVHAVRAVDAHFEWAYGGRHATTPRSLRERAEATIAEQGGNGWV